MTTRSKLGANIITIFNELELENYVMHYAGKLKISKENLIKLVLLKKWKKDFITDYGKEKYTELEQQLLTPNTVKRDQNIKTENEKLKNKVTDLEAENILLKKQIASKESIAENYAKQTEASLKNAEVKHAKYAERKTKKDVEINQWLTEKNRIIQLIKNDLNSYGTKVIHDGFRNTVIDFKTWNHGEYLTYEKINNALSAIDDDIKKLGGTVEKVTFEDILKETGVTIEFQSNEPFANGFIRRPKK